MSPNFRPTIGELVQALSTNPKQFPKKHGALRDCRAAPLRFNDGVVWRALFEVYESERLVLVVSLGPHDHAYRIR